jgi:hypothetical protein
MAFGIDDAVANATKMIDDAINKIWPDPEKRASADAVLIKAQADAAIAQLQQQMSVMMAEAQSTDPWTSRARPSFLYVMYAMILVCLPFGVLWAFDPVIGQRMADGMQKWLAAIPDMLWQTFMVGYMGYTGARTYEKARGVANSPSQGSSSRP